MTTAARSTRAGHRPSGAITSSKPADQRLYVLFQMLETMRIDRAFYERLYGLDPFDEHVGIWKAVFGQ
jgi:hypothetical protein